MRSCLRPPAGRRASPVRRNSSIHAGSSLPPLTLGMAGRCIRPSNPAPWSAATGGGPAKLGWGSVTPASPPDTCNRRDNEGTGVQREGVQPERTSISSETAQCSPGSLPTKSPSSALAPMRNPAGVSQSEPSSSRTSPSHSAACSDVRMPPAGFSPAWKPVASA